MGGTCPWPPTRASGLLCQMQSPGQAPGQTPGNGTGSVGPWKGQWQMGIFESQLRSPCRLWVQVGRPLLQGQGTDMGEGLLVQCLKALVGGTDPLH